MSSNNKGTKIEFFQFIFHPIRLYNFIEKFVFRKFEKWIGASRNKPHPMIKWRGQGIHIKIGFHGNTNIAPKSLYQYEFKFILINATIIILSASTK